ncbi:MAG: 3D domain-containing protein [Peptococcaceae bacterium]|nr:3D domain-containing protein [Peptococcaceae bacterium]MDH7526020.1 3D domain-containing protein [Peptococcaceae bacterium]
MVKRVLFLSLLLLLIWSISKPGTVNSTSQIETAQKADVALQWSTFEVTAYTLRAKECGKPPGHPDYGRTASGKMAQVGVTVAAGPEIPLGTKIYLPDLKYINGTGVFIVQERGGLVGERCLDVYFGAPAINPAVIKRALEFGRQQLQGILLN